MSFQRLCAYLLTTLSASVLVGCALQAGDAQAASPDQSQSGLHMEIIQWITACDASAVNEKSGEIIKAPDRHEIVSYLADRWHSMTTQKEDACLRQSLQRAYVANTLAQAYGNRISDGIDIQSLRRELREGTASDDPEVAALSITGLDFIAEPSDLQLFERVARESHDEYLRRDAIIALSSQCMDEAASALNRLEGAIPHPDVAKLRQQYAFVKVARCQKKQRRAGQVDR